MTTLTLPITERKTRGGIACESDSIATVPLVEERSFAYWQQDIPQEYLELPASEITARIAVARRALGTRCVVLGHHYQREDVIAFADVRGDSFKLAQWAAERPESEYIVFCGVHFMAEAADILSGAHQKVMLPNLAAGCSMSDMEQPAARLGRMTFWCGALRISAASAMKWTPQKMMYSASGRSAAHCASLKLSPRTSANSMTSSRW